MVVELVAAEPVESSKRPQEKANVDFSLFDRLRDWNSRKPTFCACWSIETTAKKAKSLFSIYFNETISDKLTENGEGIMSKLWIFHKGIGKEHITK